MLEAQPAGTHRPYRSTVVDMIPKQKHLAGRLPTTACFILLLPLLLQLAPAQSEPDRYSEAVSAYNQNRFPDARTLFETVRGAHAEDAKRYLDKIKKYREAIELANDAINRKPDELDADTLDFAVAKCDEAIAIKADGPYKPQEMREKAKALRASLTQRTGAQTKFRDQDLCRRALDYSRSHRYRDAELAGCALANDNPGYSCGGDEAANLCQEMRDLAKSGGSQAPRAAPPGNNDSSVAPVAGENLSSTFDKAVAAFDQNDFETAKKLFYRVKGNDKANAAGYLDKIEKYQRAMKAADEAVNASKLDEARSSYQEAAQIKADGPGNPQEELALLDLRQGVTEFYEGNYADADRHLAAYATESNRKADLAHFYLGASKMSEYFLAGGQNPVLRDEAVNDFRVAKKAGFLAQDLEVSPKILKAYEQVSF